MSVSSDSCTTANIYEEVLNDETICDFACKDLEVVPNLSNKLLCILYLKSNRIKSLPDDFFPSLPSLMWLDLRDNKLADIPKSVQNHPSLTHLLLQNNELTSLPNELGTVQLKVLQLNGNPLVYPPKEIVNGGVTKVLAFLNNKYIDTMFAQSQSDVSEDAASTGNYPDGINQEVVSYNSVIDGDKLKKAKTLSIQFSEREIDESADEYYGKTKGKCPKLAKSRTLIPPYYQSSKYVVPQDADCKLVQNIKMKQSYLKDLAIKKHKDLLATRDKILQGRKNMELLKNWRRNYRYKQQFVDSSYKFDPQTIPYDTAAEYMTFLNREDIEKDLPDKYKKRLIRKSKPTVPRKNNNDVHLAMKIKQLFENLEAIDLNREGMTPRTEQKVLLNEIQKITEIKQKLSELSMSNGRSVAVD